MHTAMRLLFVACMMVGLSACQVNINDGSSGGLRGTSSLLGELVVEWTLFDSTDPQLCRDYAVDYMEITIEDDFGNVFVDEVACEEGLVSYDLEEGFYDVTVVAVDYDGFNVGDIFDTVDIEFDVVEILDINFRPSF